MLAIQSPFVFMSSPMKLEIPYFQRSYVWKESNWEELFENLKDQKRSHFLGSIILKLVEAKSGELPRYSVIDGQQRLTTLSILLRACYDNMNLNSFGDEKRAQTITRLNDMLFYEQDQGDDEDPIKLVKIQHSRIDSDYFISVIKGEEKDKLDAIILDSETEKNKLSPTHSEILKCYKYFFNRFKQDESSVKQIWKVLLDKNQNLLVKIDLASEENEQVIFDSVNSTGVRLTCAEIIKNALFQKLCELAKTSPDSQNKVIKLYSDQWEKIFIIDSSDDLKTSEYWSYVQKLGRIFRDNHELLLHYVALIKGFFDPDKHRMSDLTDLYKNYIKEMSFENLSEFIKEIAEYAKLYRKIFTNEQTQSLKYGDNIQRLLKILSVCDISTLNPYILYLLKKYPVNENGDFSPEFLNELKDLETMVIRYTLCRVTTKNFNKMCADLIKGEESVKGDMKKNSEKIQDCNIEKSLYNITQNKIATLLLFWIELYRRSNDQKYDVKNLPYTYSLEHVMPQAWEKNWGITAIPVVEADTGIKVQSDETAKELRRAAIYEIGNMTILNHPLNASLSNKKISDKLTKMKEYADLGIAKEVIKTIETSNSWNEKTIRDRTKEICDIVKQLWPINL